MSRRRILGSIGALVMVALLMAPMPVQALGPRAGDEFAPRLLSAWEAVVGLWQGALEIVGLRPVKEADGAKPIGGGAKTGTRGDEGGGGDPNG